MASTTIGRVPCPECGESARVQKRDGENKRAYRWCRGCGAQYYPRSEAAEQRLLAAMVPPGDVPGPAAAPKPAAKPEPAPAQPPVPPRSEAGLFTTLFRK